MADILSRVFAQKVKEQSGATVIVENKTGANGVLAADYVAKSPANGLTVLIGFQGTQAVLPHLDAKLPYKPLTDFARWSGSPRRPACWWCIRRFRRRRSRSSSKS